MKNTKEINQAKKILKDNGYYVDYLWHIDDVIMGKQHHDCNAKDAYNILDMAMRNEATSEQVWLSIEYAIEQTLPC
jgi:hypothetical protein